MSAAAAAAQKAPAAGVINYPVTCCYCKAPHMHAERLPSSETPGATRCPVCGSELFYSLGHETTSEPVEADGDPLGLPRVLVLAGAGYLLFVAGMWVGRLLA